MIEELTIDNIEEYIFGAMDSYKEKVGVFPTFIHISKKHALMLHEAKMRYLQKYNSPMCNEIPDFNNEKNKYYFAGCELVVQ